MNQNYVHLGMHIKMSTKFTCLLHTALDTHILIANETLESKTKIVYMQAGVRWGHFKVADLESNYAAGDSVIRARYTACIQIPKVPSTKDHCISWIAEHL